MNDRLVTVATFGGPIEANLAKNCLESAGVNAFLADEEAAAMAWHLTNAFGGIKLQVREQDAEEALAVLVETNAAEPLVPGHAEAPSFPPREAAQPVQMSGAEIDESGPGLTSREENADRAFRGAVLGLLFLPLQLYVFWLLLKVYVSNEELRPDGRRRAFVAAFINLPVMAALCILVRIMLTI
jgi:hypothetical protein